ncbi:glycerophosphodiester phosphodiesterase family protein [Dinghuibacter silviterrae]|uniref:Glycerophosphoryl diester phosphodiesterase n=1 Tax=Dinghuibacter silviterrae TaxID=1539049 RepID=A0A4R8DQC8_9BACT|nr:glycerophosphodiester phosphodiesterase family protein [Dinghuibacter silviterrae]TDX00129.1 glycerophosphoryl diester phosphodiesterase [Dinghuibacter silviterrae]
MPILCKLAAGAMITCLAAATAMAQHLAPLPEKDHRFIVACHRGDHTHAPENTLAAFTNAIADGADFIEIDLRTTVDSQLVIMHDASLNRMTNGKGLVKDLPFDTIRALQVTDRAHPEWGSFPVPTFREVLALAKGKINIYLDFKNAEPAVAYKMIVEAGMEKHVVVYINAVQQFYKWRQVAPDMPLMVSLPGYVKDTASLNGFLSKTPVEILDGDYSQYTADMVTLATQTGHWVFPDVEGPNETPALWDIPIKEGVRALLTDHPADLIKYLESQGLR